MQPLQMNGDSILNCFSLHDQDGLPLEFQVLMAKDSTLRINFAAFACDALYAGWSEEKIQSVFKEAAPEISWPEFRGKLAELWALAGGKSQPECWKEMKAVIASSKV